MTFGIDLCDLKSVDIKAHIVGITNAAVGSRISCFKSYVRNSVCEEGGQACFDAVYKRANLPSVAAGQSYKQILQRMPIA